MTSLVFLLDSAAINGIAPATINLRAIGKARRVVTSRVGDVRVSGHNSSGSTAGEGFGPFPPAVIGAGIAFHGPRIKLVPLRAKQGYAARAQLFPPTFIGPGIVFRPIKVRLAPSSRGRPHSQLSPPAVPPPVAQVYSGPVVHLAPSRRTVVLHPRLVPPAVVGPVLAPPITTHFARIRPRPTIVRLLPPAFIGPGIVFAPILVRLAPSKRGKATSHLFPPVAPDVVTAVFTGPVVHLALSKRGRPSSHLSSPAVVGPVLANPIRVALARIRPPRTLDVLRPPAVVAPVLARPIDVTLAPQRRGVPKPHLSPPTVVGPVLAPPIQVTFARIRPPRTQVVLRKPVDLVDQADVGTLRVHLAYSLRGKPKSRLSPPTVVAPVLARATLVHLAYSRRGIPKSRLPEVIYEVVFVASPISVALVPSSRGTAKPHLSPPAVVAPVLARPIAVHLSYSLRGKAKPHLSPPAVVAPVLARPIDVTLVRIRPRRTLALLRRPTDLVDRDDLGFVRVHLAYSRRGKAKPHLSPPAVVAPVLARPIEVTLARIRPPRTLAILRRPVDLVDREDVGLLRTHLAYSRRGTPKSILRAPTVVGPVLARPIDVLLTRIRPPAVHSILRPPVVVFTAVELSGPEVTLAPSSRGTAKSFLRPDSKFAPQPAPIYPVSVTLAYSLRGKAKPFLRPPVVVKEARVYLRAIDVTLAPQSRGKAKSFLRPPVVVRYFQARPTAVHLAYSRRGKAKPRLPLVIYGARVYAPISVTLAPSRYPKPKSLLSPPTVVTRLVARPTAVHLAPSSRGKAKPFLRTVVYPARVYAPISVTLAPSRFPRPKSKLQPPAVVQVTYEAPFSSTFVRIRPPAVHSRLSPPAVVGDGVYFRGILTHLAYSLRGKTMHRLTQTQIEVVECYGTVCGFDFAAEVCGDDESATVGGITTAATTSGSTRGSTVGGATSSGGSVTGGDSKREGC